MADRGLDILDNYNLTLAIPTFMVGKKHLSAHR